MNGDMVIGMAFFLVLIGLVALATMADADTIKSKKPITPRLVIEQVGGVSDTTFIYEKP